MAERKILSRRLILSVLTIVIVPYSISILSVITVDFFKRIKKEKKEITLKLDDWTVLGRLEECNLTALEVSYGGIPVDNILKICW